MRRPVIAVIVGLIVFGTAYVFTPAIGEVDARDLVEAVAREAGTSTFLGKPCVQNRTALTCVVSDHDQSGIARYNVNRTGSRCWNARKVTPDGAEEGPPFLPDRLNGCVRLQDQLRIWSRLGF
jgi:hypothetical protein